MTKKRWKIILLLLGIVNIVGSGFAFAVDSQADMRQMNQGEHKVIVIAHRGGATYAPENTLGAIIQSIEIEAEMVELDVRQLKDGTFIVLHDNNFARTTGIDLNVWDADYSEVKELDASFFNQNDFIQEKVPTLDEVFDYTQNKIKVMLDVKVNVKEDVEDMAKKLYEIIESNDVKKQCIIGSTNLKFLKCVKSIDRDFITVYIAQNLKIEEYKLEYIDSFSISKEYLTKEMVQEIHSLDKPVYVWTVNSKQQMKRVTDYGVDGIVTDNVPLAQNFLQ